MYVKASIAAEHYGVTPRQLRYWAVSNKIPHKTTPGGHYLYLIENTEAVAQDVSDSAKHVLYARVSSKRQAGDLQRQIAALQREYPDFAVVSDIGSGVDFKRAGFKSILERVFSRDIQTVVVAHPDRWSRIGFDFFEWLFTRFGAHLRVLSRPQPDPEQDLSADLMELVTVFAARYHGRRKYGAKASHTQAALLPDDGAEEAL